MEGPGKYGQRLCEVEMGYSPTHIAKKKNKKKKLENSRENFFKAADVNMMESNKILLQRKDVLVVVK